MIKTGSFAHHYIDVERGLQRLQIIGNSTIVEQHILSNIKTGGFPFRVSMSYRIFVQRGSLSKCV